MNWNFTQEEKLRSQRPQTPKTTMGTVTNPDGSQYNQQGQRTRDSRSDRKVHGWEEPPEHTGGYLEAKVIGLQDLLGGSGWPRGAIIGITGIGKSGKTTFSLQEAMLQAASGTSVLYVYNESPRNRFMAIANRHRLDLGLSIEDLESMSFMDLHGSTLKDPKSYSIERYAGAIVSDIAAQIRRTRPELVVIDSLTKLCRLYPAQAYYYVQQTTKGLWESMDRLGLHPVVLCIMQKSGGHWEEMDATVLGGHGVGHELDGMIVFTRESVDTWKARELGLPLGYTLRLLRIDSLRDIETDDSSHQLLKDQSNRLRVGPTPETLRLDKIAMDLEKDKKTSKSKAKQEES